MKKFLKKKWQKQALAVVVTILLGVVAIAVSKTWVGDRIQELVNRGAAKVPGGKVPGGGEETPPEV